MEKTMIDQSSLPTLPWPFSDESGGPKVLNIPSPEGAALGEQVARMTEHGRKLREQAFPNAPPRCIECAFTKGTVPNRCLSTVGDALKCVIERVPFNCHKLMDENGEPKRLCAGWCDAITGVDAGADSESPHA
jgi:hypothetical protein